MHRRNQSCDAECFPLHRNDRAKTWQREFKSKFEAPATGAEGDDVEGTKIQVIHAGRPTSAACPWKRRQPYITVVWSRPNQWPISG